jgi:hypothetical protein
MRKKLHCSARFGGIKMRLLRAAAEMPASTEKELFLRLPTVPNMQKKAEIANILLNIMSEQRAKRGYKCLKEIAAFRERYEQHGRHGGVKRDGKKNGKRC